MHLLFLLSLGGIALALRLGSGRAALVDYDKQDISSQWKRLLLCFVVPPLLLLVTCLALVWMGPRHMHGWWQDPLCHGVALIGLTSAAGLVTINWLNRSSLLRQIRHYPLALLGKHRVRILPIATVFAAQVGGWRSELLLSRGLLERLTPEQQQAVIAHESAHAHYRDNFWFFWLGCLRQWSCWMPYSDRLWQQLLTLRELRADAKAAEHCDRLVLAETLFKVAQEAVPSHSYAGMAALFNDCEGERLALRINYLLDGGSWSPSGSSSLNYGWLLPILSPLMVIPICSCW